MECRAGKIGWQGVLRVLGVFASWLAADVGELPAQPANPNPEPPPAIKTTAAASFAPARVAVDDIPAPMREKVRAVMERSSLTARGPVEVFTCKPATYYWLLDNPDQGVQLWRMLGAQCTDIERLPNSGFSWSDGQGSKVSWQTVLQTGRQRVWYAEGKVNPGVLLPTIDVRAVAVLNYTEGTDGAGKTAIRHQIDLYLKTDSRAIAAAAKILGVSSPRVAEQYVGQMEMFFAALSWYLDQHPRKAEEMLAELRRTAQPKR